MTIDPGPDPDPRDADTTSDLGLRLLSSMRGLLEQISGLTTALDVDEALRSLGWDPKLVAFSDELASAFQVVSDSLRRLDREVSLQRSPDLAQVLSDLSDLGIRVADLVEEVQQWSPPPDAPTGTKDELVADLVDGIPLNTLILQHPAPSIGLSLVGALRDEPVAEVVLPDGSVMRAAGTRPRLDLGRLADSLKDPLEAIRKFALDESGTRRSPAETLGAFVRAVTDPLMAAGVTVRFPLPAAEVPDGMTALVDAGRAASVVFTFTEADTGIPGRMRIVLGMADAGGGQQGAVVAVDGTASIRRTTAAGVFAASVGLGAVPLMVTTDGVRPARAGDALPAIDVSATYESNAAPPFLRLGDAGSTRFEIDHVALEARGYATAGLTDLAVKVTLKGLRLVIQASEEDGLLSTVLGQRPIEAVGDLALQWSLHRGLRISGGAGFALELPIHKTVGPLTVDALGLGLKFASDPAPELRADIALSLSFALGPFSAAIQRMGITGSLTLPPERGNLGPAQLDLRGKPPSGIGLAITAPAVTGGGFLLFDADAGRYAGVFQLTLMQTISVQAIALINTKMPDGSPGFALLILITAEGFTPIQLGMGFTLTGIGGLLALNRTVDPKKIGDGLRNGVLDSILFVKDPVKNANRVLTTLDQVFPIAADRLLVGPLVEISWGTPTIMKVRLALLLDLPQPIRAVLLAALSVVLPRPEDAVVEIHIDAVGDLNLARGELSLDASLHDSRILAFALTGDMALRINWGKDPGFLLSIGGFHPRFKPPPGIRALNRLALTLSTSANPSVRFEAYLAITSNTLQMGAKVAIRLEAGGFGIDGGGSFDALIQWSPFALDVLLAAWVRVYSGSTTLLAIAVAVNITGPRPWRLTGKASVNVLGAKLSIPVDLTLGPAQTKPDPVETVDIENLIWTQISDARNWQAALPADTAPGVTLSSASSDTQSVIAHPLSVVTVQQHAVPLLTAITHVGARVPVGGPRSYAVAVTAGTGLDTEPVNEQFALGQFTSLHDDELITAPSFVLSAAGIALKTASAAAAGPAVSCDLAVETLDLTTFEEPASVVSPVAVTVGLASGLGLVSGSPTRVASLR